MATEVAINFFTIIFLVLSGYDHSVKVSSNSEMGSGSVLWEGFAFLRELVLKSLNLYRKLLSTLIIPPAYRIHDVGLSRNNLKKTVKWALTLANLLYAYVFCRSNQYRCRV